MRACRQPASSPFAAVARRLRGGIAATVLAPAAVLASGGWVPDAGLAQAIHAQVHEAAQAEPGRPPTARVAVELGRLDPRLRLAPCERVEHRLAGRAWGATRVALRCVQGPTRWQVHLPVTVQVLAPGWVAAADLPAGTVIGTGHLRHGEVDLASGAIGTGDVAAAGRTLARPLATGEPLRAADLRARQWFAAGEPVQLVAVGRGYSVSGQGQALGPGVEGQRVRVRTDSGRIVTGLPVAAGRVEVAL
jgi:flagella basal body P-ring formation protein FlgA